MDQHLPNGDSINGNGITQAHPLVDSIVPNGTHELTMEELEKELPMVTEDMVPLGELVSRTAQAIYAEMTELAET